MAINENFDWSKFGSNLGGLEDIQTMVQENAQQMQNGSLFNLPGSDSLNNGSTFSWDGAFGKDGWAGNALGAISGLANSYIGLQQLGLGRDALAFKKSSFDTNLANQARLANAQLRDQFIARKQAAGSNPNVNYGSVDDYMSLNAVSGKRG